MEARYRSGECGLVLGEELLGLLLQLQHLLLELGLLLLVGVHGRGYKQGHDAIAAT